MLLASSAKGPGEQPRADGWKGCRAQGVTTQGARCWHLSMSVMRSRPVIDRKEACEPALQGVIHSGLQQIMTFLVPAELVLI